MIVYRWPCGLRLEYEPATGTAITRYPRGRWSGCGPVPEDAMHAERLGISPGEHRLAHELAHHLVGFAAGNPLGSHVVLCDAFHIPQDEDGRIEEWHVTAVTYGAFGALNRADVEGNYFGAVEHMNKHGLRFTRLATGLFLLMPWEGHAFANADLLRKSFSVEVERG